MRVGVLFNIPKFSLVYLLFIIKEKKIQYKNNKIHMKKERKEKTNKENKLSKFQYHHLNAHV